MTKSPDSVSDAALTEVLNAVAETTEQRMRRLYCTGQLTENGLNNAVRFRLITQAEHDDILAACPGGAYPPEGD